LPPPLYDAMIDAIVGHAERSKTPAQDRAQRRK
jgi:hypothetical protein